MKIIDSARGKYKPVGSPWEADCIIGHSFGTSNGEGTPNGSLAEFMVHYDNLGKVPTIVDRTLVRDFDYFGRDVDYVAEGNATNSVIKGLSTWDTLEKAKGYMDRKGLHRPLMVATAQHIGRVVMQADKLGINSIVLPGLPHEFDVHSEQWWTRSERRWIAHEVLGIGKLWVSGQV